MREAERVEQAKRSNLVEQLRNGELSFQDYKEQAQTAKQQQQHEEEYARGRIKQYQEEQALRQKFKLDEAARIQRDKAKAQADREAQLEAMPIVVVVRNVIGRAEELAMSAGNLVGELKQAVHSRMGMQVERQRLMLGECELSDDSKTLRQYGVCDQSVVMLGSQMAAP